MEAFILTSHCIGLFSAFNSLRLHSLARARVLRFSSGRHSPRILLRSIFPCCDCSRHQDSPPGFTRERCRLRFSHWRSWSCDSAVCSGCYCPKEWCSGSATNHHCFDHRNFVLVALPPTKRKEYSTLVTSRLAKQEPWKHMVCCPHAPTPTMASPAALSGGYHVISVCLGIRVDKNNLFCLNIITKPIPNRGR